MTYDAPRSVLAYRRVVRLSIESRYPVSPDDVVAARLDSTYLETLCRRTGALEHTVEVDAAAGRSVVRRVMPTDHVPDFARKFTGETLSVVETTTWDAAGGPGSDRTGTVQLRVEGAPVSTSMVLLVVPEGTGSLETASGEITAKVPLVGGRIEKALQPAIQAGVQAQVDAFAEWSAR